MSRSQLLRQLWPTGPIVLDTEGDWHNHTMKKADYIEQVVGQEDFDFFTKRLGNLSVETIPRLQSPRRMPGYDRTVHGARRIPLQATLQYYAATLWGAQFEVDPNEAPEMADYFRIRPAFEFVNVGRYSTSTSTNQRKVFTAIDNAPRRYTRCLVIDPTDTGGKHWDPGSDWVAPMQVALDWCAENGCRGPFPTRATLGPNGRWLDSWKLAREGGRLLGGQFNADAFWMLETQNRTP